MDGAFFLGAEAFSTGRDAPPRGGKSLVIVYLVEVPTQREAATLRCNVANWDFYVVLRRVAVPSWFHGFHDQTSINALVPAGSISRQSAISFL
jgi:hypothetical protein